MKSHAEKIADAINVSEKLNDYLGTVDPEIATVIMISLLIQAAGRGNVTREQFLTDLAAYWDKYNEGEHGK